MGWQDAPTKNAWENAPATEQKPQSYTTGEALWSGAKKFVPSTGHLIGNIASAVVHPINTIDVLSDLGAGAVNKILPESVQNLSKKFDVALLGETKAKEFEKRADEIANAVGKDYVNTYGSYEGFKKALAEDPARILADASTILTGGGALAKAGGLTKTAELANTAATYTNPLNIATKTVGKAAELTGQGLSKLEGVPSKVVGALSNVNPEAYRTIYNLYKNGDPELLNKLEHGTKLEKDLYSSMIYNYSRKLGLPHEFALKPIDYTRGHPESLGAWDVWDKYVKQFPDTDPALIPSKQYAPFETLSDVEKAKQAVQAGVDTGRWSLLPPGKKDIGDVLKIGAKLAAPTLLHNPLATALESPRIARSLFAAAGKGANLLDQMPEIPLSVDKANKLGLMLYQMNQNKEQQ